MKRQVLSFKNQIMLLACMFALCCCEEVKDKVTVKIPIDSFSIQLDDITVGATDAKSGVMVRLAEELNSFHADKVISMDKLNSELADKAEEYQSKIEKVEVGPTSSITVTSIGDNGTVVKDFLMEADGINSFAVAQYNLNEAYSENVEEFATQLLMKLIVSNSVSLTVSGKTDVVSGEKLKVIITLNEVSLIAKVLKD